MPEASEAPGPTTLGMILVINGDGTIHDLIRRNMSREGPVEALEAGRDDHDTKPVELPRLIEKIEVLLPRLWADTNAHDLMHNSLEG